MLPAALLMLTNVGRDGPQRMRAVVRAALLPSPQRGGGWLGREGKRSG